MDKVDKILESISLPIELPEEAFIFLGKQRRLPDLNLVINQLPAELRDSLNLDGSILQSSQGEESVCILQITNGGNLRIQIRNKSIVGLTRSS